MPEKVNASAGTCIVALWRSLDLFMELSWQDCDRRERFDRLGLSEQLISCGIPLCYCQFSPSVFFRRLVFCDMEEDCKFIVVCRMLTKEGIAQSVAVLGAPSSIICQNQMSLYGVVNLETTMRLSRAMRHSPLSHPVVPII